MSAGTGCDLFPTTASQGQRRLTDSRLAPRIHGNACPIHCIKFSPANMALKNGPRIGFIQRRTFSGARRERVSALENG